MTINNEGFTQADVDMAIDAARREVGAEHEDLLAKSAKLTELQLERARTEAKNLQQERDDATARADAANVRIGVMENPVVKEVVPTPKPTNNSITPRAEREEERQAVSAEVKEMWCEAKGFTVDRYVADSLHPDLRETVREAMRGQPQKEIDAEIAHHYQVEATAMESLTSQEVEVAARFHQRPSEYLAAKR